MNPVRRIAGAALSLCLAAASVLVAAPAVAATTLPARRSVRPLSHERVTSLPGGKSVPLTMVTPPGMSTVGTSRSVGALTVSCVAVLLSAGTGSRRLPETVAVPAPEPAAT